MQQKTGTAFAVPVGREGGGGISEEGRGEEVRISLYADVFVTSEAMLLAVTKFCHIKLRNTRLPICNTRCLMTIATFVRYFHSIGVLVGLLLLVGTRYRCLSLDADRFLGFGLGIHLSNIEFLRHSNGLG
jgi:hypothetical protein